MAKLLDANLIIRYLLQDDQQKAYAVRNLFLRMDEVLVLSDLVVAEIVWTLMSFYKIPKRDVAEKLKSLLALDNIESNKIILNKALVFFVAHNIDFIDAYLAALCEVGEYKGIYSYDKDFDRLGTIKRLTP